MSKAAFQGSGFDLGGGGEGNRDTRPIAGRHTAVKNVVSVHRVPGDVHLRDEWSSAWNKNLKMNMRRSPGIGHGLDRTESVFACSLGARRAKALEVPIDLAKTSIARMVINTASVALPDFDARAGDRRTIGIQEAAKQMCHFTRRGRGTAGDFDEIGVRIQRQRFWIKRPGARRGSRDQRGAGGLRNNERGRRQASHDDPAAGYGADSGHERLLLGDPPRTITQRKPNLRAGVDKSLVMALESNGE